MFDERTVESSLLSKLGYDAGNRQVVATFKSDGSRWKYDGVPPNVYETVLGGGSSGSVGKEFLSLIKGKYTSQKI